MHKNVHMGIFSKIRDKLSAKQTPKSNTLPYAVSEFQIETPVITNSDELPQVPKEEKTVGQIVEPVEASMKKSDPLEDLPPRKRRYVAERALGKSKMQAAKDAGFSDSMAAAAGAKIETPDVRRAFRMLVRQTIPAEAIIERLAEGLDAEETKFFQKDGNVISEENVIAWSERREYLKLAAEYGGYFVPKAEIELSRSLSDMTDDELRARAQELLSVNGDTGTSKLPC